MAKAVVFNREQHVLYFDYKKKNGQRPYLISMDDPSHPKVTLKVKEKCTRWDFLSTFKPPQDLSIESGQIFKIERLLESSPDYDHVSKQFLTTFNGVAPQRIMKAPKPINVRARGGRIGMANPFAGANPGFAMLP